MQVAGRKHKQLFNEINITPLTDIFLVLLIIMMVVAPMMQQVRKDVKPPQVLSGSALEQNKLTVEVTQQGEIYVQGQPAKADSLGQTLKDQQAKLEAAASGNAGKSTPEAAAATTNAGKAAPVEKNLIIRADKATKSGQVLKIFEAARDAGFTKVTVAGEPLDASRQSELQQSSAGNAGPASEEAPGGTP